jgi:hypothetical protein
MESFHKKLQVKSGLVWRRKSEHANNRDVQCKWNIYKLGVLKSFSRKIGLSDYSEAQKHKILMVKRGSIVYMKYKTMKKYYA